METSHYKRTWDMMLEFSPLVGHGQAGITELTCSLTGRLESEVCSVGIPFLWFSGETDLLQLTVLVNQIRYVQCAGFVFKPCYYEGMNKMETVMPTEH